MHAIEITNPKLAGLEPRWARFRGFSLLFANPPDNRLYDALSAAASALAADPLIVRHGLRLLPPVSLHVTVWDGVNDGNLAQVPPAHQAAWQTFLDALPAVAIPGDLFREVLESRLLARPYWNLRLRCAQIENWSNISLVARLEPADAAAAATLAELAAARTELSAIHGARFNVRPHPDYTPHITLGYFANAGLAAAAGDDIARWNTALLDATRGLDLAFRRILPSVFTDMASFGRDFPAR